MTNREFALSNQLFKTCCELAKVPPTSRQASKFRRKRGKARNYFNHASKELAKRFTPTQLEQLAEETK